MKIKRCPNIPFRLLISELERKGNKELVEKLEQVSKKLQQASFKIGVKGAPTRVKRIYNRCMSRYAEQDVYCASIAWSIFCSTNPNISHCKNFV